MKNTLFLLLFCWLNLFNFKAQTNSLYFLEDSIDQVISTHQIGGKLIVLASEHFYFRPDAWVIDFETGSGVHLPLQIPNLIFKKENSQGLFYVDYDLNLGRHYLNYIDTLGTAVQLINITPTGTSNSSSNYNKPKLLAVCGDRIYVNGTINQKNCVWESDGTIAGTQVIFQSNEQIKSLTSKEDHLVIGVAAGVDCDLYHYQYGQVPAQFFTVSNSNGVFGSGIDNNFMYFYVFNSGMWRTNFEVNGTTFYSPHYGGIKFLEDKFYLYRAGNFGSSDSVYVGDTISPGIISPITLKNNIQTESNNLSYMNGNLFLLKSIERGSELARLNENDSIEMIADLAEGPNSSWPLSIQGFNGYAQEYSVYVLGDDSTVYAAQTNGNDSLFYIYRHTLNTSESLFPIQSPEYLKSMHTHDNELYWLELNDQNLRLLHNDLTQPNVTQPSAVISDTWFRQMGVSYKNGLFTSNQVQLYPQECFLTNTNEVIFSGVLNKYTKPYAVFSSDSAASIDVKGGIVIGKYDEYGNLIWVNGIGDNQSLFYSKNRLALKPNGNIVVFGTYSSQAYFDQDSLSVAAQGAFLSELDGATGKVLWKKNIVNETWSIDTDAIILDPSDNIYISFLYHNYSVSIAGINLSSIKDRVNAMAKFDSQGNIIWANNSETPWLDYSGNTHVMIYDSIKEIVTTVQSQAYYNTSSSCQYRDSKYFVQQHNSDGLLLDSVSFISDDIGSLTAGTINDNGDVFALGFYRSQMDAGNFTLQSEAAGSCYLKEGVGIIYDHLDQFVTNTCHTPGKSFLPVDLAKTKSFIYVLGTLDSELAICKFNLSGEYLGVKYLGQVKSVFDWSERLYFDVNEDYITVLGADFSRDINHSVWPMINENSSLSIWKMKNKDFIPASIWECVESNWNFESDISIFPNPSNGLISIASQDVYERYVLYDVNGKLISSDILQKQDVYYTQKIDLTGIAKGAYIIYLTNAEKQSAAKVIIE